MITKTLSSLLILFIIGCNISCKKETDKLTEFDIKYSTTLAVPTSSIPAAGSTGSATAVEFTSPTVPTQQYSKFAAEKTTKTLIDIIKFTKFDLSVSGTGVNFDFLKSVSIYIKAANVGEQLVMTKTSIADGLTTLSMDMQDVNIKNYIFEDNIQFRVSILFDGTAPTPTDPQTNIKLDGSVHVKATLIK